MHQASLCLRYSARMMGELSFTYSVCLARQLGNRGTGTTVMFGMDGEGTVFDEFLQHELKCTDLCLPRSVERCATR